MITALVILSLCAVAWCLWRATEAIADAVGKALGGDQ